jgi:ABC-type transporter Mla maintaining outer membrane lipid asymmetry permease subunit MlaE
MAEQRRRIDDTRMDDLKSDLHEFVEESRLYRDETKKSIEKLDQTFNGFRDKFEPMLEESLQERVWWKQTISEAKRKGVITVLSVGTLAFVCGLILGIKTYWHKIFPWL